MKRNILLLIGSLVFSFLIADTVIRHPSIALRLYHNPGSYYLTRNPVVHKSKRHTKNVSVKAGTMGDLAFMSGNNIKNRKVLFETDELGFRNDRSLDRADYILLGDSFGVAAETDQQYILSNMMIDEGYKTYNLSTVSHGLWGEYLDLNLEYDNLPPGRKHLIWLIFEGNDLEGRFVSFDIDKIKNGPFKQASVVIESYYKKSIFRRVKKLLGHEKEDSFSRVIKCSFFDNEMLFLKDYLEVTEMTSEDITGHENHENIVKVFKETKQFTNEKQIDVLVVFIPVKTRVYNWCIKKEAPWSSSMEQSPMSRFFEALSEDNGFNYLDLTGHFITRSKSAYQDNKQTLYFLDDTHWNIAGQRAAFDAIKEKL